MSFINKYSLLLLRKVLLLVMLLSPLSSLFSQHYKTYTQTSTNNNPYLDLSIQPVDTIIYGCDYETTNSEYIEFELYNSGNIQVNDFSVSWSVDSESNQSQISFSKQIPSSEYSSVTLGPFDLRSPGIYVFNIAVGEVNNQTNDDDYSNDSISVVIQVLEKVVLEPIPDYTICTTDSVTLSSNNTYDYYSWSNGSNSNQTTVQDSGAYILEVSNTDGCVAYDTVNVSNYLSPNNILPTSATFCAGSEAYLYVDPLFTSVSWSSAGYTSVGTYDISVSTGGLYNVEVIDTNGCTYNDQVDVLEVEYPQINYSTYSNTACEGDYFVVEYTNQDYTYEWSTGDTGNLLQLNHDGVVIVTVSNSSGCAVYDTLNFTYYNNPQPNLGHDTELCNVSSYILTPGNYNAYQWSNSSTQSDIVVNQSGTYAVTVEDEHGCENSDEVSIVFKTVEVDLGDDTVICEGDIIVLTPQSQISPSRIWNDGSTSSSLYISQGGDYWYQAQDGQCIAVDTVHVEQLTVPQTLFATNESNLQVQFSNNSVSSDYYSWDFGDGNSSNATNPVHNYGADGTYEVTLISGNVCGESEYSKMLTISSLGIAELTFGSRILIYPNPATDVINLKIDDFSDELEIEIYTELGQRLLYQQEYISGNTSITLDVQTLSTGMYFVRLTSGSNTHTEPLFID